MTVDRRAPWATIVVPTLNGEEFLPEVLDACLDQDTSFPYEVVVIDSGSTDGTLGIVAARPRVRLHRIPNREFGHGRTRNLAASLARGRVLAFLTQDATPAGRRWLAELVAPLADARVVGAFGRQRPRPGCCPTVAREVTEVFRSPPPGFFSNVSSAVRRDALATIPFRDVDYAEDLGFAADVAAAGLRTVYASDSEVWHSHNLSLAAYFRRMYDEARGVRANDRRRLRTGVLWLGAATAVGTLRDWRFIASQDVPPSRKLSWALGAPAYNVARRVAIRLAACDRVPDPVAAALSLDARRRLVAARS